MTKETNLIYLILKSANKTNKVDYLWASWLLRLFLVASMLSWGSSLCSFYREP